MTIMSCSLERVFPFQMELVFEVAVTRLYHCQNILLMPKDSNKPQSINSAVKELYAIYC